MKRIIILTLVTVLSGCSSLNVSDEPSVEHVESMGFCEDQKNLYIEAIKWRESGMSRDDAYKKMLDIFNSKYRNHKRYSKAFYEFKELVDQAYNDTETNSNNHLLMSTVVYATCGGTIY